MTTRSTALDHDTFQAAHALPRPWEAERSFHDTLYDWMQSAPWFALSAAAHLLAFFALSAFPWDSLHRAEPPIFHASVPEPVSEVEEPPEELIEPIEPIEEETDEPVLVDEALDDQNSDETDDPFADFKGDSEFDSEVDFNPSDNSNEIIGIGGGGGAKRKGRIGGMQRLRKGNGNFPKVIDKGLEWLAAHQSPDGSWDSDGFMHQCGEVGNTVCDGPGRSQHDVGNTGLALLAFLGVGHTTGEGKYRDQVARGIAWLRDAQDPDTGLIGEKSSHEFLYNHAIATLALCEAYYMSESPLLKRNCQKAIHYINRARNPYGAWRYDEPPVGQSDTSVTGWMVFAIRAAEDAQLDIDQGAYEGALSWFDEVTDSASGRVGYNEFGSQSSRITGVNDHYPAELGEAMTAVGLLCRIFMGQDDPDEHPILERHGDLLLRSLPEWDPDGYGSDMYYWYYGTYAMFQLGGKHWKEWERALRGAVIDSQRVDGDEAGSWDPVGPWGFAGGRVYSTALQTLTASVFFRYGRVAGSR